MKRRLHWKVDRGNDGLWKDAENESAVFHPSHKPWKSIKPIPTFPPPRLRRAEYVKIPKRSRPKLPNLHRPFRLISGLEKTVRKSHRTEQEYSQLPYTSMAPILQWLMLGLAALAASALAAVTGFGGAAVLLPVLVVVFGVREAVPILTVAQLIGNGSRVWFNRRDLNWRVVAWFALGGVPMALVGGYLFATAPLPALTRLLGAFLLLVVVWRHIRPMQAHPFPTPAFAGIGAGASFLSALLGSVGPVMAPFFLA